MSTSEHSDNEVGEIMLAEPNGRAKGEEHEQSSVHASDDGKAAGEQECQNRPGEVHRGHVVAGMMRVEVGERQPIENGGVRVHERELSREIDLRPDRGREPVTGKADDRADHEGRQYGKVSRGFSLPLRGRDNGDRKLHEGVDDQRGRPEDGELFEGDRHERRGLRAERLVEAGNVCVKDSRKPDRGLVAEVGDAKRCDVHE
jgi:hypothetical protein